MGASNANDDALGQGFLARFNIFLIIIFYVTLGLGLYSTFAATPDLMSAWAGAALVALVITSALVYHLLYLNWFYATAFDWPMPLRRALLYVIAQIALTLALLHYDNGFIGLGFALMGQTFGALPPRQWPLPLLAVFAVVAAPLGLFDAALRGNWLSLASFVFTFAIWTAIGVFIYLLFRQRDQLGELVVELRRAKADLEAYATQAEELAALRERARLAREMHDSLGHALVLVNVKLEAAQRLYAHDGERGAAELEATRALVRATMADLRRSLADLRAPLPDYQDLPAALQRVAAEVQARSALTVTCTAAPALSALPAATSEALWRVAREALINVERHAAAASADLSLERQPDAYVLRVIDDGSGITPADMARPGHYGIIGMRERVAALGGTLQVAARPEGGTLVEARVPLPAEA